MMKKGKKCPNCGYVSQKDEEFCPNCDQFEPTFVDFTKDLTKDLSELKALNAKAEAAMAEEAEVQAEAEESTTKEAIETPVTEAVIAEPLAEEVIEVKKEEVVIEKFVAPDATPIPPAAKTEPKAEGTPPETPVQTPKERKPFNKKILWGLLALLLLVGGYFGFTSYQGKAQEKAAADLAKEVALLENNFNKLYFNEEKVFLNEDASEASLDKLTKEVAALKDEKVQGEFDPMIEDLSHKIELQTALNQLFISPVIKGDKLANKPVLKDEEPVYPQEIKTPENKFEELINQGILLAKEQGTLNKKAKELVAKVEKAKAEVSRKDFESAQAAINKLTNQTLKDTYTKDLDKVETTLKAAEKKAADQLVAAEKEAAASQGSYVPPASQWQDQNQWQAQPQGQQPVAPTNNTQGNAPSGIIPNEGAGVQTGDWSWAPGIQDKVINESLRRGYIVEGGYELRPRMIVDGEAYYDLFATNTQSSLLKDRLQEELPIYLVTINAKTGWFKGQGPN